MKVLKLFGDGVVEIENELVTGLNMELLKGLLKNMLVTAFIIFFLGMLTQ